MERKHSIHDLYRHVFETIEDLKADKITIDKAAEIRNQVQTAVNTGKLECRFIEIAGGRGSGFISEDSEPIATRSRLRVLDRG